MALAETGGNQAKAARLLGIKATTLNSKSSSLTSKLARADQPSSSQLTASDAPSISASATSETVSICS